jgi:3-hydroxyisobutyrate dehydrogenase-like beta-hydroxyacid dehydrogenase
MTTIVVIAPGEMGAATGRRLTAHGARVLTSLRGRSETTRDRATSAHMVAIDDDNALVAEADFILSIVPPNEAVALGERLQGALAASTRKPVYIDCNAIAPQTAARVGAVITAAGCAFVDGGILGPPPGRGQTKFYLSGDAAQRCSPLQDFGLDLRFLEGGIGAASALKMSYAGITKGLGAIGAAMVLGAIRAGSAGALHQALAESQPALLNHIARFSSRLPTASYRWLPEMREIAAFLGADKTAHDIYKTIARFYGDVADKEAHDPAGAARQADALAAFFALTPPETRR